MKYFLIAGEASGDLYGGALISSLKAMDPEAKFQFWGGDQMEKAAGKSALVHYEEMAIMGFWEVLRRLPYLLRRISECKKHISAFAPDVFIPIDFPGFNLRLSRWADHNNLKVLWLIAPKVWAWKESRVKSLRKYVDKLYCILPFEQEYFDSHGIVNSYFGHPLKEIEKINLQKSLPISTDQKIRRIALLPGSRKQEITHIFPTMCAFAENHKDLQFNVLRAPCCKDDWYRKGIDSLPENVSFVNIDKKKALSNVDYAIVASGTASLEIALYGIPQTVVYKGNFISFLIAKNVVKTSYVSLVNLILDRPAVTELLQGEYNAENLESEFVKFSKPDKRKALLQDYQDLYKLLYPEDSMKKIAEDIYAQIMH